MADPHITAPPRVDVSTLSNYLKIAVQPIFEKDIILAGLKAHGRLSFGESGKTMSWPVKFRRRDVTEAEGYAQAIGYPQTNVHQMAKLPWRRIRLGESITRFEKLANKNEAAIFDSTGKVLDDSVEDFMAAFKLKFFKDGGATGSRSLHGLESMFSHGGVISGDAKVGDPNDTYAELHTDLGYYGGDWTADSSEAWPTGKGDSEYKFFSPLIVDSTNTNWTASTKTLPNTWQECFAFAIAYQQVIQESAFDLILMSPLRLLAAKQSLESTQRFELTQNSKLTEIGFRTMNYEGVELMDQYGVTDGVCYMLTWQKMALRCMQKQLVDISQDTDIRDSTELIDLDFFGNYQFDSPAFFAKILDIS